MAKIGLKKLKYGLLTETDGVATYGVEKSFGKAVDCKVAIELNAGELYADDSLAESDYSFKKGTISLTIDDADDTAFGELLGHTITTGELVRKDTDVAPFVGIGRILTKIVNGVYKYKVEFLSKVKFKEPSSEEKTRGESLEFGTQAVEGTINKLENGEWSKSKTFTTEAEAITYLDGLFTAE